MSSSSYEPISNFGAKEPTLPKGSDVCPWPISSGWGGQGHQVRYAAHSGWVVTADSEEGVSEKVKMTDMQTLDMSVLFYQSTVSVA